MPLTNSFSKAIVRPPAPSLVRGLRETDLGSVDFDKAMEQHREYCRELERCGLEVIRLEPAEAYPDATFVEDTAIVGKEWAVLTRPGAPERRGESDLMDPVLHRHFQQMLTINAPGTLDGGDVLRAGQHVYIGLSHRTNKSGAQQLIGYLNGQGYSGDMIPVSGGLHLKTGLSYLDPGLLVCTEAYAHHPVFEHLEKLIITDDEAYASNLLQINGYVLAPSGYPRTLNSLEVRGYEVVELEMSEFRKVDGGLTCLSLRF